MGPRLISVLNPTTISIDDKFSTFKYSTSVNFKTSYVSKGGYQEDLKPASWIHETEEIQAEEALERGEDVFPLSQHPEREKRIVLKPVDKIDQLLKQDLKSVARGELSPKDLVFQQHSISA